MSRQSLLFGLITALLAGALIYWSRPISAFFVNLFFDFPQEQRKQIVAGEITDFSGKVLIKHAGSEEFKKVSENTQIFHFDQIKTERDAFVTLRLITDFEIQLNENGLATLELYQPTKLTSPALLSIPRGTYLVKKLGTPGGLFILKENKLLTPQTPWAPKARKMDASKNVAPAVVTGPKDGAPIPQLESVAAPQQQAEKAPPQKSQDKITPETVGTLPSAYIEETLSAQSVQFRRCQMSSLRDNPTAEGSLLLAITIGNSGKVEEVKAAQDQIKNEQLTACVISVIGRIQFKPFQGQPIHLSYPIEFR